jgi:hypothetical protein
MTEPKKPLLRRRTLALLLVLLLALPLWAAPQATAQAPAPQSSPQAEVDTKITPEQAEELFRSVDEILKFASKETGLPIKTPVKRKLASRDEVVSYIEQRMKDDPDTERIDRASATLEKLGLLPRNFDLRKFLLGVMREQVAGFYDPKTKTVYLLDWVAPEVQRPVLAHELTHALQDQSVGLDKWGAVNEAKLSAADEIDRDEQRLARQGVVEGQAMVVLLDYVLAPLGRSVADSPALVDGMRSEMMNSGATPMFSAAPLYLREGLIFPYMQGLDFERKVLVAGGKESAFADVLKNPPTDTLQVLAPQSYLKRDRAPKLKLADLGEVLGKGWERYDYGGFGAFDLGVMVQQWAGKANAAVAKDWRGGYYMSFAQNGAVEKGKPRELSLAMVVRFGSEDIARQFDEIYRGGLASRYKTVKITPTGVETEDGLVTSEVRGPLWMATESFDEATSAKLREAMAKTAGESSLK